MILSHGIAKCHFEPRGDHGMEGFSCWAGEYYYFEKHDVDGRIKFEVSNLTLKSHLEKPLNLRDPKIRCLPFVSDVHTKGQRVFNKYFTIKEEVKLVEDHQHIS